MSAGAWADAAQVQPGIVHCLTAAGGPGRAQMSADAWADFARVQPETVDHMAAVGAGAAATGRRGPPFQNIFGNQVCLGPGAAVCEHRPRGQ